MRSTEPVFAATRWSVLGSLANVGSQFLYLLRVRGDIEWPA
jgi:hypothetical protein